MSVDFNAMALRAKESLRELSDEVDLVKAEINFEGLPTYTKAAVYKNFPKLSRTSVDKYISELESEGYQFKTKQHGSIGVFKLSIEDIVKIYERKGEPKWRDKHSHARVIFTSSLKGGVTKTVSTVSIAQGFRLNPELVKEDLRIAVIDMDPQGSATMFLNHHYTINSFDYTAAQICVNPQLSKEEILKNGFVDTTVPNVKLMPACIEDGFIASSWMKLHAELKAEGYTTPTYDLLKVNLIDKIKHDFDFIFLDTGPHLDALLLNSLVATDFMIMPAPPAHVDLHSTLTFVERIPSLLAEIKEYGSDVDIIGFYGFMTKFTASREEHRTSQRHYIKTLDDMLSEYLPNLEAFNKVGQSYETVLTIQGKDYQGSQQSLNKAAESVRKMSSALFMQIERDLEKVK